MSDFGLLVKRIHVLWDLLWQIEDVLFLGKSKTPEEAADNIKREIKKLQEYARLLNKK